MLTPDQTRLRLSEAENLRLRAEIERRKHNMQIAIDFLEAWKRTGPLKSSPPASLRSLIDKLKDSN